MKKKVILLLMVFTIALSITACDNKKTEIETNVSTEKTQDVTVEKEESNDSTNDVKEITLQDTYNWYVGKIWNPITDFRDYIQRGTNSSGDAFDAEFAYDDFVEDIKEKDKYTEYIHNEHPEIVKAWDKMMEQVDIISANLADGFEVGSSEINTELLSQYNDKFFDYFRNGQYEDSKEDSISDIQTVTDEIAESGDIEVDKGLFDVNMIVPKKYIGETTQERCDEVCMEKGYKSVTLNEDGSVTYVMTKSQHNELMEEFRKTINDEMADMIGSEDYPNVTNIVANYNYTDFTVTTKNEKIDMAESFMVWALYIYGGMYNVYNGEEVDNIHVDYVNEASGEVISSANSKDMNK